MILVTLVIWQATVDGGIIKKAFTKENTNIQYVEPSDSGNEEITKENIPLIEYSPIENTNIEYVEPKISDSELENITQKTVNITAKEALIMVSKDIEGNEFDEKNIIYGKGSNMAYQRKKDDLTEPDMIAHQYYVVYGGRKYDNQYDYYCFDFIEFFVYEEDSAEEMNRYGVRNSYIVNATTGKIIEERNYDKNFDDIFSEEYYDLLKKTDDYEEPNVIDYPDWIYSLYY